MDIKELLDRKERLSAEIQSSILSFERDTRIMPKSIVIDIQRKNCLGKDYSDYVFGTIDIDLPL